MHFILISAFTAIGLFVIWFGIFYYLSGDVFKGIIANGVFILAVMGLFNYFTSDNTSQISKSLAYVGGLQFTMTQHIQSFVIFAATIVLCHYIYMKRKPVLNYFLFAGAAVLLIVSCKNTISINKEYDQKSYNLKKYDVDPEIHLSKNGKNVMVIMMDRLVSYYMPYIFTEKPELYEMFEGFTYYPNCTSYGTATISGSPGLYGGYDYIPVRMNERTDMLLKDKQNEALKVMPVLFNENGYNVTVADPTYAGYDWKPDLSIYDDYPEIKRFITMGRMNPEDEERVIDDILKRNLFCYGIHRSVSTFFSNFVYNGGNYNSITLESTQAVGFQTIYDGSRAKGISEEFADSYNVLVGLDDITVVDDTDQGNFFMMSNDTPHSDSILKEPEYEPVIRVDNTQYDAMYPDRVDWEGNTITFFRNQGDSIEVGDASVNADIERLIHYQIDTCSMLKLGEYFDYLKEQGVYDNTRIIIVSDHGAGISLRPDLLCGLTFQDGKEKYYDLLGFQSTLFVKDFDSTGFFVDEQFMTNADVPSIATEGMMEDARNPFTGNPLKSNEKNEAPVLLMSTENWDTERNNKNTFMQEQWFSVHDNIYDGANWNYEGYY